MEPEKKSNGALVGLVVIIVILIIGGVYIWQSNKNSAGEMQNQPGLTAQDSTQLDALNQDINAADPSAGVNVNTLK